MSELAQRTAQIITARIQELKETIEMHENILKNGSDSLKLGEEQLHKLQIRYAQDMLAINESMLLRK